MEEAVLDASDLKLRGALADLLGLSAAEIAPVVGSIPSLDQEFTDSAPGDDVLRPLLHYRDIVQLDYLAEFMARVRADHDVALAKISIGTLAAARANEKMKLLALLAVSSRIREAKLQLLAAAGALDALAQPAQAPTGTASDASSGTSQRAAAPLKVVSLLVAPMIQQLSVGSSQQFAAVATFSDGHAEDVSTRANWRCSSESNAILSATGLLTALSAGAAGFTVEFGGQQRLREITIMPETPDDYLPPPR
jgi:hypothetical protein